MIAVSKCSFVIVVSLFAVADDARAEGESLHRRNQPTCGRCRMVRTD